MIRTFAKQLLSMTLSSLLVVAALPFEAMAQQSAPPAGYSGQGQRYRLKPWLSNQRRRPDIRDRAFP